MKVWILTSEVNDYNQYGWYFEAVFAGKPTIEQIKKSCECNDEYAQHVLNGGGRLKSEHCWYFLEELDA